MGAFVGVLKNVIGGEMALTKEKREEIVSHYTESEFARVMRLVDDYAVFEFILNVYIDFPVLIGYINQLESRELILVALAAESLLELEKINNDCPEMKCHNCENKQECLAQSVEKALSDLFSGDDRNGKM